MPMKIQQAVPVLPVADVKTSAGWWARLGFQADLFPDEARADFAILSRDGVELMLQRFEDYRKEPRHRDGGAWDVYLRVRDLATVHQGPVVERDYGCREAALLCPDGHVVVLSEDTSASSHPASST
jgi:hypothetical protein